MNRRRCVAKTGRAKHVPTRFGGSASLCELSQPKDKLAITLKMKSHINNPNPKLQPDSVPFADRSPNYYWDRNSNSVELLEIWIAGRGHRFGYGEVIDE